MSHTEAGFDVLHRVLLVLLVCLALLLLLGCSGDPECFAAPFLPKCFDDDDDEEKQPANTAPQATSALVTPPWLREAVARGQRASARSQADASPCVPPGLPASSRLCAALGLAGALHRQQPRQGRHSLSYQIS